MPPHLGPLCAHRGAAARTLRRVTRSLALPPPPPLPLLVRAARAAIGFATTTCIREARCRRSSASSRLYCSCAYPRRAVGCNSRGARVMCSWRPSEFPSRPSLHPPNVHAVCSRPCCPSPLVCARSAKHPHHTFRSPPHPPCDRNLRISRLNGTIPSELGALTSATFLALEGNSLTGSLPSQVGRLTRMRHLYAGSPRTLAVAAVPPGARMPRARSAERLLTRVRRPFRTFSGASTSTRWLQLSRPSSARSRL